MIGAHAFAAGMGVLTGAYGRGALEESVAAAYYAVLAPVLDDQRWERAVARAIATERFWPSPAVLLQAAGVVLPTTLPSGQTAQRGAQAAEAEGGRVFGELLALREYAPTGLRLDPGRVRRELGERAERALRAVGGPSRLRELTEEEAVWVRRDFARAYAAYAAISETGRAIEAPPDERVGALVGRTARALAATQPRGGR